MPEVVCSKTCRLRCRPLVVTGKGAAIAGADDQLRRFVDGAGLPFLAIVAYCHELAETLTVRGSGQLHISLRAVAMIQQC